MHLKAREDLLCVALPSWRGNYAKSTVQLMHGLSRYYRILYVDYAYTVKDVLMSLLGRQQVPLKSVMLSRCALREETTKSGEKLFVLSLPPLLPVNWIRHRSFFWLMSRWNARMAQSRIKGALNTLNMREPVVVNAFQPFLGTHLAGAFQEKKLIYYCYDEISEARWLGRHGKYMEEQLMRRADLVITSSKALEDNKKPHCRQITTVTNGVDFPVFAQYQRQSWPPEGPLTIGYTGSIDERFDTDLMEAVVRMCPEFEFRFVGRVANEAVLKRLSTYDNVKFDPPVSPDEVPAIMQQMDVGIIPYLKNELTRFVYPLKINEFLAMGIPVVMTPFAKLEEFEGLIYLAANADAFACALQSAASEDDDALTEARIAKADSNSWQGKAEVFHQQMLNTGVKKKVPQGV